MNFSISSSSFNIILKESKSLIAGDLLFRYSLNNNPAIGFIVSKKYGNAVSRNLFKRRCRYLFQKIFIKKKSTVVIIIKPKTKNISFSKIEISMNKLYDKLFL